MLNRKSLAIARWEFLEKVRKTSFLVFTLIFPLIIILLSLIPAFNSSEKSKEKIYIVALVNFSNEKFELFERINQQYNNPDEANIFFVRFNVSGTGKNIDNEISTKIQTGYFTAAVINEPERGMFPSLYYSAVFPASQMVKLQSLYDTAMEISRNKTTQPEKNNFSHFETVEVMKEFAMASLYSFYYSFSFLVLLAFLSLFSGGAFVRSFLYEKSNGLIELYFSSVSGAELITGKLLGLVLLGLLQIVIWIAFGLLILGNTIPDAVYNISTIVQISFFILGYIFYSVLFLGAGSLITNEYQAQQVTALLSILMIFPLLTSVEIMSSPDSIFADFLTYFPFTTAPLVIIRSGMGALNILQTVTSAIIMVIAITAGIYISAKLYNASVLVSTGKVRNIRSLFKK